MTNLSRILRINLAYNEEGKAAFKKAAISELRKLAKALKLSKGTFDIRFNAGGIAVSGDAILHSDTLYVHISQPYGGGFPVYYRSCAGRKDYHGGTNNCCSAEALRSEETLAHMARVAGLRKP